MADILADYREWRDQQAARVSTHSAGCHMWHKDCMIHRLADALAVEQAKRTLTDAEREAIREAVGAYNDNDDDEECAKIAATLHGLLKRTDVR
jgi:phage gp16-like protein